MTTPLMVLIAALGLLQVRDAPPAAGAGSISGRVIDAASVPVRRALVTISRDGTAVQTVVTDETGTFRFAGLPDGRFRLTAAKPAFLTATYGAQRPGREGTLVAIVNGREVPGLTMVIARGGVIAGRILDENGDPASMAQVRLFQFKFAATGRVLRTPATGLTSVRTDDRGEYRFYGLDPGDYVVSATRSSLGGADVRQITQDDLDRANMPSLPAAARGGTATLPAVDDGPRVTGVPVFYPGTTQSASATTISVRSGEERAGVDFQMSFVRTATVSGVVSGNSSAGPVAITLIPKAALPGTPNVPGTPSANGTFTIAAVPPGQYVLSAATRRQGAADSGLWALRDITIDGRDVTGVGLALQPGLTISGRVVFEGSPPAAGRVQVTIAGGPAGYETARVIPNSPVSPDGSFSVGNLVPGHYSLSAGVTPGMDSARWTMKSVVVNGRDVSDMGVELAAASLSDVTFTLTDRISGLSGVLQDASGGPASDYTIILFTTDRGLWRWRSRRILTVRPATEGRFVFSDVTPGDYYLSAVTDVDDDQWYDPAFLDLLVPASVRVTVAAGQNAAQDIRIR